MIKPIVRVTAGLVMHSGKILCARKAPGKPLAGYWEFPGGKVEAGESDAQALARELREELGLDCRIGRHFATNMHETDDKIIELVGYWAESDGNDLVLTDHDCVRWLHPGQLPELNWAPADRPIVTLLTSAPWPVPTTLSD